MPIFKQCLAYFRNIRHASVTHFKKQILKQAYCLNVVQSYINDNKLNTSNTSNIDNTNIDTDADMNKEGI